MQLTFQPAFDPFHAIFRLLRLLPTIQQAGALHRDHVRILDFYLLFPFRVSGVRLRQEHRAFRRLAYEYESARPYGELPEDRLLFSRMEPMQVAALDTLAEQDFIEADRLALGEVKATTKPLPAELVSRVNVANENDSNLMKLLALLASEYQVSGSNGLKHRTDLLEHRYDAI